MDQLVEFIDEFTNLEEIKKSRKDFGYYKYNNIKVPRVSHIIKASGSKQGLIDWAARVGYNVMDRIVNDSTTIGTAVHEMIQNNISTNTDSSSYLNYDKKYEKRILRAYNNFKFWRQNIESCGYKIEEVYGTEVELSCPYYAGTADCICRINGKNYILDWKTSKSINNTYINQVCAYRWIINNGYSKNYPYIDGIGIIRIDKLNDGVFDDYFLNSYIPVQNDYLNAYTEGFFIMLANYYTIIRQNYLFTKQYNDETFQGYECIFGPIEEENK